MNPTVRALNLLSIFGPSQGGAYREHSAAVRSVLGDDIPTLAGRFVEDWASGGAGVLVLTGNAGTGKTALAEAFCRNGGADLPDEDELLEVATGHWVVKDLSGVGERDRAGVMTFAEHCAAGGGRLLLCANEGVLRGLLEAGHGVVLQTAVEDALRGTVGVDGSVTAVNMNRQRWTAPERWSGVLDYLTRGELWTACDGCGARESCPLQANAEAMRRPEVRSGLRAAFRLASAETVAPLREVLTVLAHAITGGLSCEEVSQKVQEHGRAAFTAETGYFNLVFAGGMKPRVATRSPLMKALEAIGVGAVADLQLDAWLREAEEQSAPQEIRDAGGEGGPPPLKHVRVGEVDTATFAELGRVLTIDSDPARVRKYQDKLLGDGGHLPLWRRKLFFEAPETCANAGGPFARLTDFRFYGQLLDNIEELQQGRQPAECKSALLRGLNYLACGMAKVGAELYIPDPGLLSARNPGSLLPSPPMVVYSQIDAADVMLTLEPSDGSAGVIDHDDVRLLLRAVEYDETLLLTPRLFEILMDAGRYRASPGIDAPEVADLRLFYANIASRMDREPRIRIATEERDGLTRFKPPVLEAPR